MRIDVTLNDKIGPEGRTTVYFRGRQVAYYRPATGRVDFAPAHQDAHQRDLILGGISEAIGAEVTDFTNPPELPPPDEALEPLDVDE